MKSKLFWSSLIFSIAGWIMVGADKIINFPSTEVSRVGVFAGVLGIFGIILSLTD